jgi:hypothetical protein
MAFVNQVFDFETAQIVAFAQFPNGIDCFGNGVLAENFHGPRNHYIFYILVQRNTSRPGFGGKLSFDFGL